MSTLEKANISDFGANTIHRFATKTGTRVGTPSTDLQPRQARESGQRSGHVTPIYNIKSSTPMINKVAPAFASLLIPLAIGYRSVRLLSLPYHVTPLLLLAILYGCRDKYDEVRGSPIWFWRRHFVRSLRCGPAAAIRVLAAFPAFTTSYNITRLKSQIQVFQESQCPYHLEGLLSNGLDV